MCLGRTKLFLLVALSLLTPDTGHASCSSTTSPNILEVFQKTILRRRTRSIIFPKNAQLLLTPAITKGVLGGVPRTLSYSIEFDMYSALPDTIEGWRPTILYNEIEKERKRSNYQKLNETAKMEPQPETTDASYDSDVGTLTQNADDYESLYSVSNLQYDVPFDNNWNGPNSRTSLGEDTIVENFHRRPYLAKSPSRHYISKFNMDGSQSLPKWFQNQHYRERRQIFDQLEALGKILNINGKDCIRRAMCEVTTHLKPFGEYLIEDIIRILLTIPNVAALSNVVGGDDYNHQYDGVNCARRFAASCPYNVLHMLTQNLTYKMDTNK